MKKFIVSASLFCLPFFSQAGGPKNNSVKESIKSELYKSNFVANVGMSGDVLIQFRIDASGKIIVEDSNSNNEELAQKFIEFAQTLKLTNDNQENHVYKMRFIFRLY